MDVEGELRISPPHGQKRQPEDDLQSEQRLTKRFNLLNLEQNGKLYIPIQPQPVRRTRSNAFSDSMQLDDSRDRIFIHNLDDEIEDTESDEGRIVFLPDIEKRFTNIPKSLLGSHNPSQSRNELVLYTVPESLSIPREQDNVRKAIIESRQRALEKQNSSTGEQLATTSTTGHTKSLPITEDDTMDID